MAFHRSIDWCATDHLLVCAQPTTSDRWRDTSGFVVDQGRRKNTVGAGAFAFDLGMESGAGRGAQAGPLPGGHHGPGRSGGGPAGGGRGGFAPSPRRGEGRGGGGRALGARGGGGRALRGGWPTGALRG